MCISCQKDNKIQCCGMHVMFIGADGNGWKSHCASNRAFPKKKKPNNDSGGMKLNWRPQNVFFFTNSISSLHTELVNHWRVIHYLYYDNVKHLKNQRASPSIVCKYIHVSKRSRDNDYAYMRCYIYIYDGSWVRRWIGAWFNQRVITLPAKNMNAWLGLGGDDVEWRSAYECGFRRWDGSQRVRKSIE